MSRAALAAALAAACLVGCAGDAARQRSVLAGNPAKSLLVLPLNVAAVMPSELEAASPVVWEELEIYLRAQGKELKTVSPEAARYLWVASIQEARKANAKAGYDEASKVLVAKLSRYAAFDAVIAPSLTLRKARIQGRNAKWDGVERPVDIEAPESLPNAMPLEGVAPAASLHAVVLDAQGNKIDEGIAGLEVLVGVRVIRKHGVFVDPSGSPQALGYEYTPRTDLFASRANVQEGIAKALAGFLPPLAPVGAPPLHGSP